MRGATGARGRPSPPLVAVAALGVLACALAACTPSTGQAGPDASPTGSAPGGSTTHPGASPSSNGTGGGPTAGATPGTPGATTGAPTPATSPGGTDPLAGWTLEEEVGQLLMVGVDVVAQRDESWAAVRDHHVGNVFVAGRSHAPVANVAALVRSFTDMVGPATTHSTPMLVATDQEGGAVQVLGGPGFSRIPAAVDQARMPVAQLEDSAATWGRQLHAAGITLDLAPVMDLVDGDPGANPPVGAWGRQYGSTPAGVVDHANAFSRGLRRSGVAVAVKHFPGLGRVDANTDTTAGVHDTVTTRGDRAVEVFARGIADGAESVMVSTAVYDRIDPHAPAAFSRVVVEGVLRGDLGFDGVVITDDLSAAVQVGAWTPGERAVEAVGAGCDLVLVSADPGQAGAMADALVARARADPAFAARVAAAARRVLAMKAHMP